LSPEESIFVLKWQVAATIMMGLDYFIPDAWRLKANNIVKNYFQGVQQKLDSDVALAVGDFKKDLPHIAISVTQVALGIALLLTRKSLPEEFVLTKFIILIIALFIIISGISFAFGSVLSLLQTLGVAGPFRVFTMFLVSSPKGPLAAIGFIFLAISFYLRYTYIST